MYNAELKSRFVKDYTKSINTANVATTVFEAFEPYETSWNADLCTRDREELQPAIDEILGTALQKPVDVTHDIKRVCKMVYCHEGSRRLRWDA